ncbi:hypothetical protein HPHPP25_0773 [Helicobacter pylori Hp P-25]|nr:hypothetical protein HPHPP25_0773 [Helicobacter pylori Hp P-25]
MPFLKALESFDAPFLEKEISKRFRDNLVFSNLITLIFLTPSIRLLKITNCFLKQTISISYTRLQTL